MDAKPRTILHYLTEEGGDPFEDWLDSIRDGRMRHRIISRIERAERGNMGVLHSVGDGVSEMILDLGPGYRAYFGFDGDDVILLGGGDQDTQSGDIRTAKKRWEEYNA